MMCEFASGYRCLGLEVGVSRDTNMFFVRNMYSIYESVLFSVKGWVLELRAILCSLKCLLILLLLQGQAHRYLLVQPVVVRR